MAALGSLNPTFATMQLNNIYQQNILCLILRKRLELK